MDRNNKIDFLRVFGTFLVMLAHVQPPNLILNIRTFDVIMLVFISGMSYALNKPKSYLDYISNRFRRLIIPTYITITIIFFITFFMCIILGRSQLYDSNTIIKSYLFADGIGYIWIAKVFFIIAMFSPLFKKICIKIKNDYIFLVIIVISYLFYDLMKMSLYWMGNVILNEYIFLSIPYCLVASLGIRSVLKKNFIKILLPFSAVLFMVFQVLNNYDGIGFAPSNFKFPPGAYYILYGMTITLFLLRIMPNFKSNIIFWLSKNSFTIYLAHIFGVMAAEMFADLLGASILKNWMVKYIEVAFIAITVTHVFLNSMKHIYNIKKVGLKC